MKIVEFANSVDPDEVAHHEPPHLDLCCLPTSICIISMRQLRRNFFFLNSGDVKFASSKFFWFAVWPFNGNG